MSLVVTGATGHLGRHVVESLLARGVAADQIVAGGRNVKTLEELADRGVQVRLIDFDEPATLRSAFEGADKLLLVSGTAIGERPRQHRQVIEAAHAAGVSLLAYTSGPHADSSSLQLLADHKATEEILRDSGVPYVLLRNSWYFEGYTGQLPTTLARGAIVGSAGDGRISGAARADYAEAAAVVLTSEGHAGAVYELGGDESFTLAQLAAEITKQTGTEVIYRDVPVSELQQILSGAGLPEPLATIIADIDRGIAAGELLVTTGDLSRLIGRPTTSLAEAVAAAITP